MQHVFYPPSLFHQEVFCGSPNQIRFGWCWREIMKKLGKLWENTFTVKNGLSRSKMAFHGSFTVVSRYLFLGESRLLSFSTPNLVSSWIKMCWSYNTSHEDRFKSWIIILPQIEDENGHFAFPAKENPSALKVQHVEIRKAPAVPMFLRLGVSTCFFWGMRKGPNKLQEQTHPSTT